MPTIFRRRRSWRRTRSRTGGSRRRRRLHRLGLGAHVCRGTGRPGQVSPPVWRHRGVSRRLRRAQPPRPGCCSGSGLRLLLDPLPPTPAHIGEVRSRVPQLARLLGVDRCGVGGNRSAEHQRIEAGRLGSAGAASRRAAPHRRQGRGPAGAGAPCEGPARPRAS
jgi:hypothetical protein